MKKIILFGFIGVLNTAVDLAIFAALTSVLNLHFVIANIISTASALALSYILNSRFTFNARTTKQNVLSFLIVTLVGLWALQPFIIIVFEPFIRAYIISDPDTSLLASKLIATGFSLTWNFVLYKFIVFKKNARP